MTNKEQEHLKHLIFNDTCSMHRIGTNHNASDRSMCYDVFSSNIKSPIFSCHYNVTKERYEKEKAAFIPCSSYCEEIGVSFGWASVDDVEQYADESAKRFF